MQPGVWYGEPLESASAFGFTTSMVLVILFGGPVLGMFLFSAWRYFAHQSRALRAESAEKEPHPAVVGPALLTGTVETDDGGPAVRIEIDQTGTEQRNKNAWSHVWTEKNRKVEVRPFRLRLAGDDKVVTVDPDERVHLVDVLETSRFEGYYRRRVAELAHKEKVWVSGVLSEEGSKGRATTAYRAGQGGLVLHGSRTEPLEVASGELGLQFAYWQIYYRTAAIWLGIATFVLHGLFFGPFLALCLWGKVEMADFTKTSTYTTTNKGHTTTHYVIMAHLPAKYGSAAVKDDVRSSLYETYSEGQIRKVPFIFVPWLTSIHSIGRTPDMNILGGVFGVILGFFAMILFGVLRSRAAPWYEQRKVVEQGSGRLEEKAYYAQVPGRTGLYEPRLGKDD